MGDVTRQPGALTDRPLGSDRLLVALTAGVGVTWALLVLGDSAVRTYNAWVVHQWLVRTLNAPGPDVTHPSVLGSGELPVLSALVFLVFIPLTLLWLVLTLAVSLSGHPSRSNRIYLAVVVVAAGAQILFSVAAGAVAGRSPDPFHPALLTPTVDFSLLLTLDGLIALAGSVWFWNRGSR